MPQPRSHLGPIVFATGALLVSILGATLVHFRADLRDEIHQRIIERDAAVLYPVALRQIAEREASLAGRPAGPEDLLAAALDSFRFHQQGIFAVAVFDANGLTLQALPETLLLPELEVDDFNLLLEQKPVSHYYPAFPLDLYFASTAASSSRAPVLEVLLPLHGQDATKLLGFAQYYLDARPLAGELASIDQRIDGQTAATLSVGIALIVLVVTIAYFGLRRAQRTIAERTERLTRANFELTLALKSSALGQITSHLLHGLQGPVAGLRAAVASHNGDGSSAADWQSAAGYAERLQTMIHEIVSLLGDIGADARYDLSGRELTAIIRERNAAAAAAKGLRLAIVDGCPENLESHRGNLLCLIATNLVQNAIEASAPGTTITVTLTRRGSSMVLTVADKGPGISPEVAPHLFTPGRTGRAGGTGLGLAISRLLAGQIGGELSLVSTGPDGTIFSLVLPLGSSPLPAVSDPSGRDATVS